MKVSVTALRVLRACESQIELFIEHFGVEVTLTPELVREHGDGFELDWAIDNGIFDELNLPKHDGSPYGAGCPLCDALRDAGGATNLIAKALEERQQKKEHAA